MFDEVLELVREAIWDGDKYGSRIIFNSSEIAMKINRQPNGKNGSREKYQEYNFKIRDLLRDAINVGDPNEHACKIARKICDLKEK